MRFFLYVFFFVLLEGGICLFLKEFIELCFDFFFNDKLRIGIEFKFINILCIVC